jgi:hypothetical protein
MNRGEPYVICGNDGQPVTPAEAKDIIAARWTVSEEVRKRRRNKKVAGKAPQTAATGPDRRGDPPPPPIVTPPHPARQPVCPQPDLTRVTAGHRAAREPPNRRAEPARPHSVSRRPRPPAASPRWLDTAASIGNQIPPSRQKKQVRGHLVSTAGWPQDPFTAGFCGIRDILRSTPPWKTSPSTRLQPWLACVPSPSTQAPAEGTE